MRHDLAPFLLPLVPDEDDEDDEEDFLDGATAVLGGGCIAGCFAPPLPGEGVVSCCRCRTRKWTLGDDDESPADAGDDEGFDDEEADEEEELKDDVLLRRRCSSCAMTDCARDIGELWSASVVVDSSEEDEPPATKATPRMALAVARSCSSCFLASFAADRAFFQSGVAPPSLPEAAADAPAFCALLFSGVNLGEPTKNASVVVQEWKYTDLVDAKKNASNNLLHSSLLQIDGEDRGLAGDGVGRRERREDRLRRRCLQRFCFRAARLKRRSNRSSRRTGGEPRVGRRSLRRRRTTLLVFLEHLQQVAVRVRNGSALAADAIITVRVFARGGGGVVAGRCELRVAQHFPDGAVAAA